MLSITASRVDWITTSVDICLFYTKKSLTIIQELWNVACQPACMDFIVAGRSSIRLNVSAPSALLKIQRTSDSGSGWSCTHIAATEDVFSNES
jgi:hypothetical protein